MSAQTTSYSPDFQRFLQLVDESLMQSAEDARELAERTGTPLVVRDVQGGEPASETGAEKNPAKAKTAPRPDSLG